MSQIMLVSGDCSHVTGVSSFRMRPENYYYAWAWKNRNKLRKGQAEVTKYEYKICGRKLISWECSLCDPSCPSTWLTLLLKREAWRTSAISRWISPGTAAAGSKLGDSWTLSPFLAGLFFDTAGFLPLPGLSTAQCWSKTLKCSTKTDKLYAKKGDGEMCTLQNQIKNARKRPQMLSFLYERRLTLTYGEYSFA